jgi:hypothetical protein
MKQSFESGRNFPVELSICLHVDILQLNALSNKRRCFSIRKYSRLDAGSRSITRLKTLSASGDLGTLYNFNVYF